MPHETLRLTGGADVNQTPVLNQMAVSVCQNIRYRPDNGAVLVEKLGGWQKYFPNVIVSPVRALWAWEDTQSTAHLAVGAQTVVATGQAQLSVITNGSQSDITPRSSVDNITAVVTSVAGNSIVTITDATTTDVTNYDSVYIPTQIAIGGLILFGLYQTDPDGHSGSTTYTIQAKDVLGNPLAAPSSSAAPTLPQFTTTSGSNLVTVTLAAHGLAAGGTFPVLIPTTVGGVTFSGNYIVVSITDANNFVITASSTPNATTNGFLNGNKARYVYSFGVGAIPPGTGYGIGGYGKGGYGSGLAIVPATGSPIAASDWTLDNWGEILVACPVGSANFQPIYVWNSDNGGPTATIIPQAPPVNDGIFIAMPERQIIAWGSTFTGIPDPLLIRWCDINNYNVWIAQVINQAGSYRIPKGSRIVGGIQGPQQGIIWTDIGCWTMQYISQPLVYGFTEIGTGCGLIGRKAAATINGEVYWMGPSQFFKLSDTGVDPIVCPIWDVVFQNLDQNNLSKIRVAINSRFNEIAWYYPSLDGGGEVDSYVKYNILLGANGWDYGSLARSAWIDQSVLGPPIGADPNTRYIYQHETSPDADGQPLLASFRTGYAAMGDGDAMTFVDQFWPDMKFGYYGGMQSATVSVTFYVANYPGDAPRAYGPFSFTQATEFISPRFRGRNVAIELSSSDVGSWWRIGGARYRYAPDGKF
jgi:hypothetical protein